MYESIITPIAKTVSTIFLSLALLTGYTAPVQAPIVTDNLGANISAVADFTTSLSAGISSSATTMTLVSFNSGSDSLTVGDTYGFKLGGREYVIGTASTSNQIVNMTRGVSRSTGTTTIAAYQTAWGRGTSVEITDAPILIRTANILGGKQFIENPITYDSSVASSTVALSGGNLVNVDLLNYTAFNAAGAVNASETVKGLVELATPTEMSSSTSVGGTGARLVIPATQATSTWTSAALAAGKIPVAQPNTGLLDQGWLPSTITKAMTFSATTTLATTTISGINPFLFNSQTFTSTTTTTTFTVPNNVTRIWVKMVGAGGGGGGGTNGPSYGTAGGGGAYSEKMCTVTAGQSITVTVGAEGLGGNTSGTGGTSGGYSAFGTCVAANGGGGGSGGSATNTNGAAGGAATTTADISIPGQQMQGYPSAGTVTTSGANSVWGFGTPGATSNTDASHCATSTNGYGAGGAGGSGGASGRNGGRGCPGLVKIVY